MSSWAYIMYIVMDSAGVASFLYFIALVLLQAYFVVGLLVVRVEGGAYDSGVLACAWGCVLGRRCVIGGKLKDYEACRLSVPCSVVLGRAALPDQTQMPATWLPLMSPCPHRSTSSLPCSKTSLPRPKSFTPRSGSMRSASDTGIKQARHGKPMPLAMTLPDPIPPCCPDNPRLRLPPMRASSAARLWRSGGGCRSESKPTQHSGGSRIRCA